MGSTELEFAAPASAENMVSNAKQSQEKHMNSKFTSATIAVTLLGSAFVAQADGQSIYSEHCSSCHNGGFKGFMAGAPKVGKDSAWKEYFAVSVEESTNNVFNGSEKHKAMGEEESLTLEEVKAAVGYITSITNIGK